MSPASVQSSTPARPFAVAASDDSTRGPDVGTNAGSILASINAAVVVVGPHWRITYANTPAVELSGQSAAGLHGQDFWSCFRTGSTGAEQNVRDAMAGECKGAFE